MRFSLKPRQRVLAVLVIAASAVTAIPATATFAAADPSYEIRTFVNKCLDVRGSSTANSAPIIQFHCTGNANQRFRFVPVKLGTSPQYEIRTFANKCLDVRGGSTANSAPIIQFHCTGNANQRFRVHGPQSGYEIRTFANKCLDVRGGSTANSAPIIQFHCTGNADQRSHSQ
ncbi:RICIN domain-containing protein [Streptomyces sp. NPDC001020]